MLTVVIVAVGATADCVVAATVSFFVAVLSCACDGGGAKKINVNVNARPEIFCGNEFMRGGFMVKKRRQEIRVDYKNVVPGYNDRFCLV